MANFNFEQYASNYGLDIKHGPGNERILACILCGREEHFYYNIDKNVFDCKHCGESGNYLRFIMLHQKCSYREALSFVDEVAGISIQRIRYRLQNFWETVDDWWDQKLIIPPPRSSLPVTVMSYPKFFNRRGYQRDIIMQLKPRFCNGGTYSGRIIFPFTCDGHSSFVAYATNQFLEPKTLNPKGSNNADLLFGYDLFPNVNEIVLVEGITDLIRLAHWGYAAFALLGSSISTIQTFLLFKHVAEEIIVCYDGDITINDSWIGEEKSKKFKRKGIISLVRELIDFVPKKVTFALVNDPHADPDSLTQEQFKKIYDGRVTWNTLKRLGRLKNDVQ